MPDLGWAPSQSSEAFAGFEPAPLSGFQSYALTTELQALLPGGIRTRDPKINGAGACRHGIPVATAGVPSGVSTPRERQPAGYGKPQRGTVKRLRLVVGSMHKRPESISGCRLVG